MMIYDTAFARLHHCTRIFHLAGRLMQENSREVSCLLVRRHLRSVSDVYSTMELLNVRDSVVSSSSMACEQAAELENAPKLPAPHSIVLLTTMTTIKFFTRNLHSILSDNLCENPIRLRLPAFFPSLPLGRESRTQQFDLASPPLQHPKYYLQQQQLHHHPLNTQPSLMVGSCQGNFQTPLTNLNTATLDRFPTPPSPSLFVSTSSTNPVCSSNEPVSIHEIYCCRFHMAGLCLGVLFDSRFSSSHVKRGRLSVISEKLIFKLENQI